MSLFFGNIRSCLTKDDSGDVCSARNTQVEQGLLGLFLGEAMSVHDRRDGIGDFCVADYLAEFDEVHLVRYYTPVLDVRWSFVCSHFGPYFSGF